MPGPPPKDPSVRQRRNQSPTAATLDPEGLRSRVRVPKLPPRPDVVLPPEEGEAPPPQPKRDKWQPQTLVWWRDVHRSPVAAKMLGVDRHALLRLACLVDDWWHHWNTTGEVGVAVSRELRMVHHHFGLTPLDRWRLQWALHEVGTEPRKIGRGRGRPPAAEDGPDEDEAQRSPVTNIDEWKGVLR